MVSVLRWVENSNVAGRTVPDGFVVLLADDGDRQLRLLVEEVRRSAVQSVPAVPLSPLFWTAQILKECGNIKFGCRNISALQKKYQHT